MSAASAECGAVSLHGERLKKTEKHLKYEDFSYYSNHSKKPVLDPPPPYSEQSLQHFEKAPASKAIVLQDVEFTDKVIGKGRYGVVHLAYYQNLKVATKSILKSDYCKDLFMNECQTLCQIRHPNIVTCMGMHIKTDGTPCLVMEYVQGSSLYELVDALHEGSRTVSLRQKTHILFNINLVLVYLHSHGILHGDLTSSNVLLDGNLTVKVIVSKLSLTQTTQSSTVNGNHYYMPIDECCTEKGDIFSSAVIAIELINQEHPRVDERECEEVNRRRCDICDFHHKAPKQLHGLVMQCLEDDPNSRPTAKEIHSELNNFLEFLDTDSGEAFSDRKFSQQASDLCKVVPPNEPGTEGFFLCPSKSSTKAAKSFVTEDTQEHEKEILIYSTVSCLHPIATKRPKAEHVSPLPTLDEGSDEHSELVIGRSSWRDFQKSSPSKVVTKTMQTKESEMNTETQSSHAKGATNTVSNSEHTTIDGGCLSETSNLKPQTSLNHTDHVSLGLERYQPSPILGRSPCSTVICYCPTSIIRSTNHCTRSLYCVLRKRFIFSYGHLDIAIMMKEDIPIVIGARVVIGNYSVAVAVHISSNREELLKHHAIQQHVYFSLTERATNPVNNSDHSAIDSRCLLESPDIKPQSKSLVLVGHRLSITYIPCSTVNLYCPTSSISIIRCTSHCIRLFYSVLRERFIFSYGYLDIAIMMKEGIPIAIGVRVVNGNYSVAVATHISSNQEELLKHHAIQQQLYFSLTERATNNSDHSTIDSRCLLESPDIKPQSKSLVLVGHRLSITYNPCSTVNLYCPTSSISIIRCTSHCIRLFYSVLRERFIFSYGYLDIAIMMKEGIPIAIGVRVVNGNYSVAVATHISSNQEELLKHHAIQQQLYFSLTERATNNSDHSTIDSRCLLESPDIKPQSKSLVLVGYRLSNPCSTVNLYCPTSSISIIRCTSHCIRLFYSVLRKRFIFSYGHLDIAIMMKEDIPIAIGARVVIGNYSFAVATHISSNQEELLKHRTIQHHVYFFLAFNNSEHTVIDSRFLCESPNPQISTNHVSLGLERYQPSPILVRSPCSTVIYYCPTSIIKSTNDCTRSLYCVLRKRFIFSYGHLDIAIMMKEDIPIVIGVRVVIGNYSVAVAIHISSNREELLKHHAIQQHVYFSLTERATNPVNNSDHSTIDSRCLLESPDIKPQSKSLVLVGYRLSITYNPCSTVNLYCPTSSISIIRCTSHCIRLFYSVLRKRFIFSYGHLDIAIMMKEDIPIAIGVRVVIGNYSVAVATHISSNQEELLKHHAIQQHLSFCLAFNNSEHTVIDSRFLCESPNPQISTNHVSLALERYQPSHILGRSPCSTVICYCPTSIIKSTNDCTHSLYCVLRKRFIFSYGHLDIAIMMKEDIPIVIGARVVNGNYSVAVATHISSNQEELLKHRTVQTSECLVSMKNTSGSSLQKNIHIHTETCTSKFAPGPTDFVEWSLCKRITSAGTATISRILCVICQTHVHTKLHYKCIPNEKTNMLFSEIFIALLTGQLVAYKLHRLSSFHYLWSYSTEISKFDESTSCNGMLIPNNVLQQKLSTTTMYEFHHSSKYCYCTLRIVHNTTIIEFALLSALHNIINQSSVRYNWSNLHKSNTRLTYNLLPLMNSSLLTVKKAYVSTTSMLFRKLFIGNLQEKQQQLSLICSFTNVSHMTMHQGKSNISCKFSTNFQCVKMPHSLQAHLYRSCAVHQEPSNTGLTMMKLNIKVTRYCYFYQNNFNECCRVAMTMTVRVSTPNREYCIFRYAITKMILHKHNHLMTLVETQSETFFPMPENIPVFMATNMDYPEPQNCLMLSNETKDILPKNEHFCSHALTNIARVNQALSSTQPKKTHCMRDLSHTQPSRCHSTKQPEIINSQPRITKVERKRRKRRKRCSRDSPTTTGKKRRIQSDGCDRQGGVSRKRINSKKVQILQTKKTRCSRDPLGTTSKKRKSHDDGYDRWNSIGRRRNSSRQVKVYKTKRKRTRKKRKYSTDYDTILCDTACIRFSTTKAMRWYINKTKRKKHVRMMTKMCGESRRIRVRCWMAKKWPAITKYIKNLPHILPLDLNQPVRVMCTLQSGSSNTASGGSSNAASSGKGSSGNPCDRGGTDNHASPGSAGNGKRRDDDDNDGNRDKKTMPDKDVDPMSDYESSDSEEDDNWPYQGKTGPKPESTLQFQVPPKGKESGTESDGKEKRTQYNSLPPQSYDGLNSEHLHGTKHPMGGQLDLPKGTNNSSQAETKPSLNDSLPKPFVTVTDIDHDIDTSAFDDLASAPIEETSTPESISNSVLGNDLTLKIYRDLEIVTGFLPLNSNYLLLCPLTSNHRDNEDSDEYDALEQQEEQLNEDLEDNQQGSQDISNHHDNEDSDGSVYYDALEQQEEQLNDEQDFDQQGSQDVTIEVGDGGHESDDHRWEAAEEYTEDDRSHLVEVNNDHRDNDLEEAEEECEFPNSAETVPTLVSIRPSKLDTQLSNVATVCVPTQEEIEMMTPHDAALLGHHYQPFPCCMGPDNIHPGSLCTDPVQERPVMVSNFYMGMLTHTISPSLSDLNIT